jgi:hypothetical protein
VLVEAAVSVAVEEAISVEEETAAAAVVVVRGLQGPAAAKLAKAKPAKVMIDFIFGRERDEQ